MNRRNFEFGENFMWFGKTAKLNCPEAHALLNPIRERYRTSYGKSPKYIDYIVCNAYMGWAQNKCVAFYSKDERWVAYNLGIKDRNKKFSVKKFRHELAFLSESGYIEIIKGMHNDDRNRSMCSRFFPTAVLEEQFDIKWQEFIEGLESVRLTKTVIDADGHETSYTDTVTPKTDSVKEIESYLTVQNNLIAHKGCTYTGTIKHYGWDKAKKETVIVESEGDVRFVPHLTAIYKESYDLGGRLYSQSLCGMASYQSLSKKERQTIKIEGRKTVELDYSCLHLAIMYANQGLQLVSDAYSFLNDRKMAKKLTIIAINNKTRHAAILSGVKWCRENGRSFNYRGVSDVIDTMLEYHAPIRPLFFKDDQNALKLQNMDGRLMVNVMKRCSKRGIIALPIHDSVIVDARYKDRVMRFMKEEFKAMFGKEIEVKE